MIWKTWLTGKKEWVCAVCAPFSCIHAAWVVYSLRKLRERSYSHGFSHSVSVYHLLSTRNIAIPNSTIRISIMDFCQEKCLCKPFCCHINNTDKQVWLHLLTRSVQFVSDISDIFVSKQTEMHMFLNIIMGFSGFFCQDLHIYVFYMYHLILPLTFQLSGQFPSNVMRGSTQILLEGCKNYGAIKRERERDCTNSIHW